MWSEILWDPDLWPNLGAKGKVVFIERSNIVYKCMVIINADSSPRSLQHQYDRCGVN